MHVESTDFTTTFDGRKCDHTTRIPLCCKTPLERTLGELPCLCSAQSLNMLVNRSVSRAVQAICAERSTSANNDGDGDGREKAGTADGGTFARLCVRGRRKVCRAQLENILDVQRRSDTTFPIRVHSTCMYSNATSASAQLACNMTVQHVQVCREMRWPRPSHDSWPRRLLVEMLMCTVRICYSLGLWFSKVYHYIRCIITSDAQSLRSDPELLFTAWNYPWKIDKIPFPWAVE